MEYKNIPIFTPTAEEAEAIKRAKEQIENGEVYRYATFEEMELDMLKDDPEDV